MALQETQIKQEKPVPRRDSRLGSKKTHTVWKRMRDRGDGQLLERLKKEDIYCVLGAHDHIQNVLEKLELPHTVISQGQVGGLLQRIKPEAVLLFNCGAGTMNASDAKRLRDFVQRGGYLFTSDWQLSSTIEVALPGYIGKDKTTGTHNFPIRPDPRAENHPYLRDVFPKNVKLTKTMKWRIDSASYTVKYLKGGARPLIVSDELKAMYGSGTVACTFRHGKGSVLHVLGHLEKQQHASGDRFALLQLLVNFVAERQRTRRQGMR